MRYRFFAEDPPMRAGTKRLKALLMAAVLIFAALSLSKLSLSYHQEVRKNRSLTDAVASRQEALRTMEQQKQQLSTTQGIMALGYELGLVMPEDLVFFDGG